MNQSSWRSGSDERETLIIYKYVFYIFVSKYVDKYNKHNMSKCDDQNDFFAETKTLIINYQKFYINFKNWFLIVFHREYLKRDSLSYFGQN